MTYTRKKPRRPGSAIHIIAVDFDGVIMDKSNLCTQFGGAGLCIGRPIDGVEESIERLARRYELVVFSSRAGEPEGLEAIQRWLEQHHLDKFFSGITHEKINALAYIDDRGVRFENWANTLEHFNA